MSRHRYTLIAILAFVVWPSTSTVNAAVWPSGREVAPLQARPFDLRDVTLLDGPFREAMRRNQRYLHDLESDRLLWYFRKTAGLATPGEPMGGWERMELRGHTMGHYLSACALMVASTGDEKLKAKADAIIVELARCQKALGSGYLSAYPEEQIDRVIALKQVWAPWYTLHKIYAGLIDMYVYCGNAQALEIAQGMARWAKGRLDPLDRAAMQEMLNHTEQGGMNETLANLYGVTGERAWLELAERFNADAYNNPLILHRDEMKGLHVNSFIPNVIGTARQYELTGAPTTRRIAEFFWRSVVHGRTYCTGGTSIDEHWRSDPYRLADQLGAHTQETCCTYNMLKLTRHLFAWEPDAAYMDYYERSLINSILATQDPSTGMMMYFVTLASGCWKYFNTPRDSFWCCTGSGLENHAKYADTIYFHNDDTLWVNLFIASELNWKGKGIIVRQQTSFPEVSATKLTFDASQPVELDLRLRVPEWATQGVTLKIDGQPQAVTAQPGSFLSIRRTWQSKTQVEMTMPMGLWLCPMPDDPNLAAVMYGPLVLAGALGEVPQDLIYTTNNWFQFPEDRIVGAPVLVTTQRDPQAWIHPVEGKPLTFRTNGVGRPNDVTLVPYHRLFDQHYAIYWRLTDEAGWQRIQAERRAREEASAREAARQAALDARKIDAVEIGVSDSEKAHQMKGENTRTGTHAGCRWRDAENGWFEYRLKVLPSRSVKLHCTYWGSDSGRVFDILVDGTKIATQKLAQNKPGEFFDVEYAIDASLIEGKESVVVRFSAHRGSTAGGLFGCATLRPNP
ncbi:beta-L-arabinofuranosidase domain-containing protein [Anaerobaca lacustris]|uniref:Glycoside hydrolase family 127 protein n=1 Tax=Anaerobaca lacustris TaxID=3044600 RepID=A0AAW6U160_9BACT|nr:glycoside hydrolase family 127 protein [Sedimentisphaerales bacterium M17dextr]